MNATIDISGRKKPNVKIPMQRAALSEAQQQLVESNYGLVFVHLKHYVTPRRIPWTQREWDDLVQEGALGLIRAAQDFDPQGSIPFAAFALPRIHTTVRRAMLRRMGNAIGAASSAPGKRSYLIHTDRIATFGKSQRNSQSDLDTVLDAVGDGQQWLDNSVGARLREKFERAVRRAVEKAAVQCPKDSTDPCLPDVLARERYLFPDPINRKPYRRIAHDAQVSYGRVMHFDRLLRELIRRNLEGDPEFDELLRLSQTEYRGLDSRITESLEKRLALLSSAELLQRLIHSSDQQRGQLAAKLFSLSAESLKSLLLKGLQDLPPASREDLLCESAAVPIYNPDTKSVETPAFCTGRRRFRNLSKADEKVVDSSIIP